MSGIRVERPSKSLAILARDKIVELIERKELVPGVKIPAEGEFARRLGVSRGILREAYRLLEEDGLIRRRPGIGTFVINRPEIARNPLEVNLSVGEIIESTGATAGAIGIKIKCDRADSYISRKLGVALETPIIIIERVRTADGKPVVYAINIVSKSLIDDERELSEFEGSFYELLEKEYGHKVGYSVAKIVPTTAGPELSAMLKVSLGDPLLLIEHVAHNENARPLLYAREYWIKNAFEFTLLRKPKSEKRIT